MSKHKWINEIIWYATVNSVSGDSASFPVKIPRDQLQTKSGFMHATLHTIKEAHYAAFGQGGFGIKNIILARRNIRYCVKTRMWELT